MIECLLISTCSWATLFCFIGSILRWCLKKLTKHFVLCLFVCCVVEWLTLVNKSNEKERKKRNESVMRWNVSECEPVFVCMCVSVFCYAQNGRAMWCGRFGGVGGGERMHIYFFYIYVLRLHSYTNIIFIDFFLFVKW